MRCRCGGWRFTSTVEATEVKAQLLAGILARARFCQNYSSGQTIPGGTKMRPGSLSCGSKNAARHTSQNLEREVKLWAWPGVKCQVPAKLEHSKQSFTMKIYSNQNDFLGGVPLQAESRFENAEIGPIRGKTQCGHFGRKLQKIFPLPRENSEPEKLRNLLLEIQAKLNNKARS